MICIIQLNLVKIYVVEKSMERSWDLYQMKKSPIKLQNPYQIASWCFLMIVLIQSSGDDLLSEDNLQEPFLCSWTITQ